MFNRTGSEAPVPSSPAKNSSAPPEVLRPADPGCLATPQKKKRRILFVVGDRAVSEEFRQLLQARTQCYEVAAATNAAEALSLLEARLFDGVLASAQLPGSTGVDLLNDLSRRFPNVVRLIRYTPQDKSLLRGFLGWPPGHLTPEMDPHEIESGLECAFQVAEWMSKPSMKTLLPKMQRVPTIPELYTRVMDLLASPKASTEEVGQLIAKDPALTVKMLQMVNSAAFALAHPIANAVEAVLFLGTERTKGLILAIHTAIHFDLSPCDGFSQEQFWRHSLGTAALARSIVQMETQNSKLADDAFTAGLLHDIGKLLLAANVTEEYERMLGVARHQKISDAEAEQLAFGTTHAELGACLLGTWGLPLDFLRAICWHHAPSDSADQTFSLLTAVHVANALDHGRQGEVDNGPILKLDRHYLTRLELNDRWLRWREIGNKQSAAV